MAVGSARHTGGSILSTTALLLWILACSDDPSCAAKEDSCLEEKCCEGLAREIAYSYDEAGHRSTSACTCIALEEVSSAPEPTSRCSAELLGDGVCDDADGTGHCESDPDDCAGPEAARTRCEEICADVAARACPADQTSYCADSCFSNLSVDHRPVCRELWLAAYECGASDDEKTCDDDGRSQIGATCQAAFADYAAECAESF